MTTSDEDRLTQLRERHERELRQELETQQRETQHEAAMGEDGHERQCMEDFNSQFTCGAIWGDITGRHICARAHWTEGFGSRLFGEVLPVGDICHRHTCHCGAQWSSNPHPPREHSEESSHDRATVDRHERALRSLLDAWTAATVVILPRRLRDRWLDMTDGLTVEQEMEQRIGILREVRRDDEIPEPDAPAS